MDRNVAAQAEEQAAAAPARQPSAPLSSLYGRAILWIAASLALVTFGFTWLSIVEKGRLLNEDLRNQVRRAAEQQAVAVSGSLWNLNRTATAVVLQGIARDPNFLAVVVLDGVGNVFAEIGATRVGNVPSEVATSPIMIEDDGRPREIGRLVLHFSHERVQQMRTEAVWDALRLGLVQLVVVLLVSGLALRAVIRPIEKLTDRMLALAGGDVDKPVPYTQRPDQLGSIARAVGVFGDAMKARVEAARELEAAHGNLERLVEQRTAQLRLSETRFHGLFDANPHAICVYDLETLRLIEVNQALVQDYGWSREELLSMTLDDIHPPEERGTLHRSAKMRRRGLLNLTLWRKDGSRFEVETVVRALELDGRRVGLAISQDITEQNQMRARLSEAVRAFPGSFRLYDRNERLVLFNDKHWMPADAPIKTVLGMSIEEAVRAAAEAEADAAAKGRKEEWYRERLAQFRSGQTNVEVMTRDGRWHQLIEQRTLDGGTISIRIDITARKIAEAQLRQNQKLEMVGQMTGGIAHDFNNLLAVVIMKMEVLQEELTPDSPYVDMVDGALAAATRGADLVARLLAFSRRRELNPTETSIGDLLTKFRPLLKAAVPQVELTVEVAEGLPPCLVDRTELETAILNLAVNARDAMPNGGPLRVTARQRKIRAGNGPLPSGALPGDWIEVAVTDAGTGIPPELLSQIFEPFFTTKGEGKGTGLGLSMVFGFATQSGGFVTVDSAVGRGTTIALCLPYAVEAHRVVEGVASRSDQTAEAA